jgi:hypothetical protein
MEQLDNFIETSIKQNKILCILHAPRAGSHAFSESIAKKYNLKEYMEIFHPKFLIDKEKMLRPSIAKICMIWNGIGSGQEEFIDDDCATIKLLRRDTDAQLISYLRAVYTNKWHSNHSNTKINHSADIDNIIQMGERYISMCNQYSTDITVYYEDLVTSKYLQNNSKYKKISVDIEIEMYLQKLYRNYINNKSSME